MNTELEKLKHALINYQQAKRDEADCIEKRREFLKRVAFLGGIYGIYFGWNYLVLFIRSLVFGVLKQSSDIAEALGGIFIFVVLFRGNFVIVERLASIFKFELPHDNALAKTLKGILAFILMFMFNYIALYVPYMFYEWLHMKWLQMNF